MTRRANLLGLDGVAIKTITNNFEHNKTERRERSERAAASVGKKRQVASTKEWTLS